MLGSLALVLGRAPTSLWGANPHPLRVVVCALAVGLDMHAGSLCSSWLGDGRDSSGGSYSPPPAFT